MSLAKDIAGLSVGLGAMSLVKENMKGLKSSKPKNLVKSATKTLVGTALLVPTSQLVNKL